MLESAGKAAAASVVLSPQMQDFFVSAAIGADAETLIAAAGRDRVTVLPGKTYLMGWAGFTDAASEGRAPASSGRPRAELDFRMAKGSNPRNRTIFLSQATSAEPDASWLSVNLAREWGGDGSGETSEGFGPDYSLGNDAYCESCSTCGAIFSHWKMNLMYHDAKDADHYEPAMYNALLGSVDLEGKNFYYQNPLAADSLRYPWHVCPCCVGNIPRTLLMMPTWTYARDRNRIYINLFVGSIMTVENVGGVDVDMVQETNYPWDGRVSITVNPKKSNRFSVRIRVPNRDIGLLYRSLPEINRINSLSINGKASKPVIENGHEAIRRTWNKGEKSI
jgi:hypothetical protein